MIRFAILLALLVTAPIESRAQIPDISATPHQLRSMTPAQLGNLLFGAESPQFTDAWVEGPTRQSKAISVELATRPVPTGYAGLCAVMTGAGYFDWHRSGENMPAELVATPFIVSAFLLASDVPALEASDDRACDSRRPLSEDWTPPTIFSVFDLTTEADGPSANAGAARFGLVGLVAAREAARRMPVKAERCRTGFTDFPASCGDPAVFVRSFYLRQIVVLILQRCPGSKSICVDARIQDLGGLGVDHIVIGTGETAVTGSASPAVRSITVRAGSDPIYD